jgi:DNA-binding CsgD family transcriptional regulator
VHRPDALLLTVARVVQGAAAGVVLYRDGGTAPLPGFGDDALLAGESRVLDEARVALQDGHVHTSFQWPRGGRHAPDGHVRVTVLVATDDEPRLLPGLVLLSPAGDLRGLTPRELEILGLLSDGCPNQAIARALGVAPRTVAAHVKHILVRLKAPSRTLAAVRAQGPDSTSPPGRWPRGESLTSNDQNLWTALGPVT